MESRYLELLKKAKTVNEMLDIERYITEVRTDIESMEGKLKYMQDRISLSTLEVTYYEKIDVDYGFGSRFAGSLNNGWQNLLVVIVGLANIWPLLNSPCSNGILAEASLTNENSQPYITTNRLTSLEER
jgi:hypothetical protein